MEKQELKYVKHFIIAVALLCAFIAIWESVQADTLSKTCTPPTKRADGTTLLPSEIKGYNWYVNGSTAALFSTTCALTVTGVYGTGYVTASTIDTADTEGAKSPQSPFTLGKAPPNPPVIQ